MPLQNFHDDDAMLRALVDPSLLGQREIHQAGHVRVDFIYPTVSVVYHSSSSSGHTLPFDSFLVPYTMASLQHVLLSLAGKVVLSWPR